MPKLTLQQLESHLLRAANILRTRTAGQDYKTYILSLMFFKRLSDQWDREADDRIKELEAERGKPFTEPQRKKLRESDDIHRFNIPDGCHWADVMAAGTNTGEKLNAATRGIADANAELRGVFGVDWNQPAPDGSGEKLIANQVVVALLNHFNGIPLSNADVSADILGRAYEYLIKHFADDAGAKAGEFFTPPEVVDCLIRILEPQPGDTVYDPTCGSGGMLVHSADFLKENGHDLDEIQVFGQEFNWQTYAIAKINVILHGMKKADIRGGKSTIIEPQFLASDGKGLRQFDIAIANFPFSDSTWWLAPEKQLASTTGSKAKKKGGKSAEEREQANKLKKMYEEYTDGYGRFVQKPPASYGDFAYIQHIVASLTDRGKAGVVCPQGVLFRGQPETEEEEGDGDDKPRARKRKADAEYLIRHSLVERRLIDAVIALPLNIFYGAGVPACLLILGKDRPRARRDKVLLVYAARHFRELSNKNQLRPQDVMRILVHYHAYGDAKRAATVAKREAARLKGEVKRERDEEIGRIRADFEEQYGAAEVTNGARSKQREKDEAAMNEAIAEANKRADEDLAAIDATVTELADLYANPAELAKHARVVDAKEIEENEYNLNIPRYVDTFEPEEPIDVTDALKALDAAETARADAEKTLRELLRGVKL